MTAPADAPLKRKIPVKALIGVGVVLALLLIWQIIKPAQEHTDDATIDAHVVMIAPKLSGYIEKVLVNDNQHVKAGEVIAVLDDTDYKLALTAAKARLVSAEAKLESQGQSTEVTQITAPSNLEAAQSDVDSAKANWVRASKDLNRLQNLGDLARSRSTLDAAIAAEKSARAAYDAAQARLKSAQTVTQTIGAATASVKDLEAQVAEAQAAVDQATTNLSYTQITAPFDGRVTDKNMEVGGYVQPGQQLGALVSDDVWVTANFKENQLKRMKPGQHVKIKIDAYPSLAYNGVIDSVQAGTGARFSAFPPENATGNFVKIVQRVPVKITFTELPPDHPLLGPGMSVEPTVDVGQ